MGRNTILVFLAIVAAGALGALVGSRLTGSPAEIGRGGEVTDQRVLESIERLSERLDRLAARPLPDGPAGAPMDTTVLEERLAAIENKVDAILIAAPAGAGGDAEEITTLSDEAVLTRARSLNSQKAYDQAIGYWLSILDRNPDEKVKAEALGSLGTAWSVVGQHEKAEDAYLKLIAHHGENTEEGMGATFALGWAQFRQEDFRTSAASMERVIASPVAAEHTRTWARVNRAFFGIKGGETDRPRELLLALKTEFGDDDSQSAKQVMYQVTGLLRQLDAK
jgi:tetratricopeptide (TPR) repeat protein